jgi:hypothetical protein
LAVASISTDAKGHHRLDESRHEMGRLLAVKRVSSLCVSGGYEQMGGANDRLNKEEVAALKPTSHAESPSNSLSLGDGAAVRTQSSRKKDKAERAEAKPSKRRHNNGKPKGKEAADSEEAADGLGTGLLGVPEELKGRWSKERYEAAQRSVLR